MVEPVDDKMETISSDCANKTLNYAASVATVDWVVSDEVAEAILVNSNASAAMVLTH